MHLRSVRRTILLVLAITGLVAQQSQSPRQFWMATVKGPLSKPNAEDLFRQTYKDAHLPPLQSVPYLEGSVVSSASYGNEERVLLSMDDGEVADAMLLLDERDWRLKAVPQKGTVVRFTGAARAFTREPFMVTFTIDSDDRLTGLDVEKVR